MTTTALIPVLQENSLSLYLREIAKFPMLDPDREYMLARRYHDYQDLDAAHELTTSHLRLAAKVALTFRHYGLPLADLISEANIGLMQAIKKFDPEKGFRLSTYAIWWIKAAISDFILKSWSLVKIGTVATQKRLFYNLGKIKAKLGLYHNTALDGETVQKISHQLGVSEQDIWDMEQRLHGDSSLNETTFEDSSRVTVHGVANLISTLLEEVAATVRSSPTAYLPLSLYVTVPRISLAISAEIAFD